MRNVSTQVPVSAHRPSRFGQRPRIPGALQRTDRRGCLKAEAEMAALAGELVRAAGSGWRLARGAFSSGMWRPGVT